MVILQLLAGLSALLAATLVAALSLTLLAAKRWPDYAREGVHTLETAQEPARLLELQSGEEPQVAAETSHMPTGRSGESELEETKWPERLVTYDLLPYRNGGGWGSRQ